MRTKSAGGSSDLIQRYGIAEGNSKFPRPVDVQIINPLRDSENWAQVKKYFSVSPRQPTRKVGRTDVIRTDVHQNTFTSST